MTWSELDRWWLSELERDPAYETVVTPLLLDVLAPRPGCSYLDLGCGEGRVMKAVAGAGSRVHGYEINPELARLASRFGPTTVGELPGLGVFDDDSFDGAYCVLVLEHIADHSGLFAEVARVVKEGGAFALVMNHPMWTAPGSTPITDDDGEVLWRPGAYFSHGQTEEPAGPHRVVFHHRPLGELLTGAAGKGWALEELIETPHHELEDQAGVPRLMACRWRLLA